MRIEILTDDNPLYVLPFFEEFLKNYSSEFEIAHISMCRPMGNRSRAQLFKELSALYGASGMARIAGRLLSARMLGMLPLSSKARRFFTLSQLCSAYGIPFQHIGNPNADCVVRGVQDRNPDIIVSVACPYVLKRALLCIPPLGCINIHHAPLPKYKGMMPTFWQMFHGEKMVGVTIHYMVEKLDEGQALLQDGLPIESGESLDHLIRRSKRHGAHCMATVLRQMRARTHMAIPLSGMDGSYFTFPSIQHIREFRQRGLRAL
jgi:methionyl-tRNA formyltransferase